MNKRAILLILFTLLTLFQAHAVLKEQDLESTLSILRTELTNYHAELERQSGYMKSQQAAIRDKLFSIMGQSNQNALMLYSQKPEYVFDMAYACHEATEQYDDFKKNVQPFRLLIEKNKAEIARYDYLINSLSTMNVSTLSKKAQTDKSVCLTFAVNIRHTLNDNSNQFKDYINYSTMPVRTISIFLPSFVQTIRRPKRTSRQNTLRIPMQNHSGMQVISSVCLSSLSFMLSLPDSSTYWLSAS